MQAPASDCSDTTVLSPRTSPGTSPLLWANKPTRGLDKPPPPTSPSEQPRNSPLINNSKWFTPPPCKRARPLPVPDASVATALAASADPSVAVTGSSSPLFLSPMSQLNVLSQISELAEASKVTTQREHDDPRHRVSTHAWAAAAPATSTSSTAQQEQTDLDVATRSNAAMAKRKRSRVQVLPVHSATNQFKEDIEDWETCSGSDDESDWVFDDDMPSDLKDF